MTRKDVRMSPACFPPPGNVLSRQNHKQRWATLKRREDGRRKRLQEQAQGPTQFRSHEGIDCVDRCGLEDSGQKIAGTYQTFVVATLSLRWYLDSARTN